MLRRSPSTNHHPNTATILRLATRVGLSQSRPARSKQAPRLFFLSFSFSPSYYFPFSPRLHLLPSAEKSTHVISGLFSHFSPCMKIVVIFLWASSCHTPLHLLKQEDEWTHDDDEDDAQAGGKVSGLSSGDAFPFGSVFLR